MKKLSAKKIKKIYAKYCKWIRPDDDSAMGTIFLFMYTTTVSKSGNLVYRYFCHPKFFIGLYLSHSKNLGQSNKMLCYV